MTNQEINIIKENECLGDYISRIREHKGYTLRELAQQLGISHTTLSRIESGTITNPTTKTLRLLAEKLEIDELYLLRISGHITDSSDQIASKFNAWDKFKTKLIAAGIISADEEPSEEVINTVINMYGMALNTAKKNKI